jgi:hypothetical protein
MEEKTQMYGTESSELYGQFWMSQLMPTPRVQGHAHGLEFGLLSKCLNIYRITENMLAKTTSTVGIMLQHAFGTIF